MITIFGKNLSAIQGKTTQRTVSSVCFDYIEVPINFMKAHHKIILTADVMFVSGIPFFVILSTNVKYFTMECLGNKKGNIN